MIGPDITSTRALGAMAPHAGYVYSGGIAGKTIRRLEVPPTVIILAPNHTGLGAPISVAARGAFRIPGADVPIDEDLATAILQAYSAARADDRAHEREHAVEVELPFLVARRPDVRIVPIVLGALSGAQAAELGVALARAVEATGADAMVLASSDMSHYLPDRETRELDRMALDRLLALDTAGLPETVRAHDITMCGVLPATAMLAFARARGGDAIASELTGYATSGEAFGDYDRVVGYAGVVVFLGASPLAGQSPASLPTTRS
jgi:AmmeMemoRadiSam system protein B